MEAPATRRILAVATALLALGGCIDLGQDVADVPIDTGDTESDSDTDTGGDTDTAPVEHFVSMEGNAFVPADITVAPGDIVTWTNNDAWYHIISEGTPETRPPDWISPAVLFGETWSYTFDEVGDQVYFCDNHAAIMRDAYVRVVE